MKKNWKLPAVLLAALLIVAFVALFFADRIQRADGAIKITEGYLPSDVGNLFYTELYLHCWTRLLKPTYAVFGTEAFNRSLFHYRLAVGNAVQSGVQRIPFDRECVLRTNITFELCGSHALKQLLECRRFELYELYEYSFCRRKADISTGEDISIAREAYFPIADPEVSAAYFLNLIF